MITIDNTYAVGGVGEADGPALFGRNSATKIIIHQKGMLSSRNSQKLYPLALATIAGQKAIRTQKNASTINHIADNVTPKIVVANI